MQKRREVNKSRRVAKQWRKEAKKKQKLLLRKSRRV
jgi:hypothetical protein